MVSSSNYQDANVATDPSAHAMKEALEAIGEVAKRTASRLHELHEENAQLRLRAKKLEQEIESLRRLLERKDADISKLKGASLLSQRDGNEGVFAKEEVEALKAKIRDLLVRITTYLGS